jgi:hypothetical protein
VIVYLDLNNNGVRDADEPFDAADASGNYLIGGLLAGTYTVRVDASTLPDGVSATYDLDGVGTPGVVTGVTLSSGQARTDVDFGYRGTASIGDRVWNDANANGIQDAGETGVSGIVVALYDSTGTLLITTTTDLNGNYLFDNLPAGTYTVGVGATPGRSISPRGAGSDSALDSDIDRATRRSNPITLAIGEDRRDIDIGLYQLAAVGSLVWLDRDLDGIREADEPGIGGIEVRCYAAMERSSPHRRPMQMATLCSPMSNRASTGSRSASLPATTSAPSDRGTTRASTVTPTR